ncbi:MAG TPA: hypothetical protein PK542_01030 [Treponemataceae bacterium]|nr:hypothetical protein [Treponemataceae bacterium]
MFLLIIGAACALCSLAAAVTLHLSLPGWKTVAGLSGVAADRVANIDVRRLRRRLSLVFYFIFAGFLALSILLSVKVIPSVAATPSFFAVALVAFNAVIVLYRRFDRNVYSSGVRHSSLIAAIAGNAALLALCAISFLLS